MAKRNRARWWAEDDSVVVSLDVDGGELTKGLAEQNRIASPRGVDSG